MQRDRLMAYQPWGQVFRSVACGLGCELLDATVFDAGIAAEPASLDNRLRLRRLLCSDAIPPSGPHRTTSSGAPFLASSARYSSFNCPCIRSEASRRVLG